MAEGKKSFVLYTDQKEMFEHLPPELCKKLLMHLFSYVSDEDPKTDDPILNALFAPIKHQLKRDLIKWENKASSNRENGKKGGRPKTQLNPAKPSGLNENPTESKKTVTVNDTVTVIDNVNDNKKERKRFTPPRLLEVFQFMIKKGLEDSLANKTAQKFINHYTSNGWMVGSVKMVDWQAAVDSNWLVDKYSPNGQTEYTFDEVVAIHNNPKRPETQQDFEIQENKLWKLK